VVVYSAVAARSRVASQARALDAVDVIEKDAAPAEVCSRPRDAWSYR
jgi:hypothetical protein